MAKRLRAARHYQRRDDPVRALADRFRPAVARDLRGAFENLGDMVPVKIVADALRRGISPLGLIDFGHYKEILHAPFGRLARLHLAGAALSVRKINGSFVAAGKPVRFRKVAKKVGDAFNFDALSQQTLDDLRQQQDDLIQQLDSSARDSVETIIADGVKNGTDPDDIAAQIRDFIGLTDTQAQAVLNYQQMLNDLDPVALTRQLRNEDYDAALQDAIDSGTDLADQAIDNMVQDYKDNYLDYRADAIARTESTRAANAGLHDGYRQAQERGALPEGSVTRTWQLAENPCPICESIPDMNPDGVGLDDDFKSVDGPVTDPPVHTNCQCSVNYATDLSQIPDEQEDADVVAAE